MKRFAIALLFAGSVLAAASAAAQPYPTRAIKLVVPHAPGGQADFIARTLQPKLGELLGQPVVVDNKVGAGGIVAAEYVARQANDGYTVLLSTASMMVIYPEVHSKLSYDAARDFTPVGIISTSVQIVAVHPSVPADTVQELITYAKANPGKMTAGVAGMGSILHFAIEQFKTQAGIDILIVPYKTAVPAVADLLSGEIKLLIDSAGTLMPHVKSGRVKALAVSGKARLPALPGTPTLGEAGLNGFDAIGWQGLLVPAGTPPAIVAKLAEALAQTMMQPDVRDKLIAQGLNPAASTPEQFAVRMRAEREQWGKVAKTANIQME